MLVFPSAAYKPDFEHRRMDRLFAAPPGEQVLAGTEALHAEEPSQPNAVPQTPVLVYRVFETTSALHVLAPDGRELFATPLEHTPADGYDQLNVMPRGDRYYVWYQPLSRRGKTKAYFAKPQYITELNKSGQVIARHELPPPAAPPTLAYTPGEPQVIGPVVAPFGIGTAAAIKHARVLPVPPDDDDPLFRAALPAAFASGLACALLTFLLGRRYAFPPATLLAWTAGNVVLGPAGVLTLIALYPLPTRERCPSCGRKKVVTRETCPFCAARPVMPAMDGTEIFAT